MDNTGRAALVTGASRGIGAAIVREMAKAGYSYIGINYSKDLEGAQKTAEEVRALGAEVEIFQADVSKKEDCKAMGEAFIARFGKIDVLVNNSGGAGVVPPGKFDDYPLEYWDQQIALNLNACAYNSHWALRDMKVKGTKGAIVNISSQMAYGADKARRLLPYQSAKAGMNCFTMTLANEAAPFGIRVNGVAPGFTLTPLVKWRYGMETLMEVAKTIPIGCLCDPEDIANAVLFLADNEKSRCIVGQTILIDGGQFNESVS